MNSPFTICSPLANAPALPVAEPRQRPRAWGLVAAVVAAGLASCSHTPEATTAAAPAAVPVLTTAPTVAPVPVATTTPTPAAPLPKETVKVKPVKYLRNTPLVAAAPAPVVAEDAAAPAPEPTPAPAAPTTRTQAGRILDENGQPLIGATVMLRGSAKGTSTDASGSYSLEVPTGANTFSVGYGGYEDETATSSDGQPLNVTLLPTPSTKAKSRRARH